MAKGSMRGEAGGMCGRGHAWQGGMCVCGGGAACVAGVCMAGGHAWQGNVMQGVCVAGGMCGRGRGMRGSGGMCGRRDDHYSRRCTSYWNAFLSF